MMNNEIKPTMHNVDLPSPMFPPKVTDDDDINLIEIYQFLVKRKTLILGITIICTLLGCVYAFWAKEMYNYSSAIRLGALYVAGTEKLLGDSKNAVSELNEVIIPNVLREYYEANSSQQKTINIIAALPKDSDIIILSSKCEEQEAVLYKQLMATASDQLILSQNNRLTEYKQQIQQDIGNAKARISILVASEKENNQQIANLQKMLKSSASNSGGLLALALTNLLDQLQTVSQEKYTLESYITSQESSLKLSRDTRLLSPVTRSIAPVGVTKLTIILISVFFGLFMGILCALIVNFIHNAQAEMKKIS